jgi:hypothetical protein
MGQQRGDQQPRADGVDRWPVRGTPGGWRDGFDAGDVVDEIARIRAAKAEAEAQARALAHRRPDAPTRPPSATGTE